MTDIKVLSRDEVEIAGRKYGRERVKRYIKLYDSPCAVIEHLGWREILRMMDAYEEPAPKWEPGTVVANNSGLYFLRSREEDEDGPGESWKYIAEDGSEHIGVFMPSVFRVHRLPHEFLRGDWFECESDRYVGQVKKIDGDYIDGTHHVTNCRHVPPPKELPISEKRKAIKEAMESIDAPSDRAVETSEKPRKQALSELAQREQADGHYRCDVEENPFTGEHWNKVEIGQSGSLYPMGKCLCELRDELTRIRDLMAGK